MTVPLTILGRADGNLPDGIAVRLEHDCARIDLTHDQALELLDRLTDLVCPDPVDCAHRRQEPRQWRWS